MFAKQETRFRKTTAQTSSPTGKIECRACLNKFSAKNSHYHIHQAWPALSLITTKPELGVDGLEASIANDLAKICNIQVMETDKHSKLICSNCCSKLYHALQFVSTVQKNDQILKQRNLFIEVPFNYNDKIWPKPIQVDKNINGVLGQHIKEEILSDDEIGTHDSEQAIVAGMGIKIEPEEILPIKITVNGTISQDEMNTEGSANGCEVYENVEHLDMEVKEEPMSDDEDQGSTDLSLDCMLCTKPFNSVSGLKAHVIANHSYKSVKRKTSSNPSPQKKRNDRYVCATCRRTFVTSTDLMVHETCHNKSVCYGCNEKFDTFELLSRHRRRCKAIRDKEMPKPKTLEDVMRQMPEELKLRKVKSALKCSLCTEEFSDAYYMKIHHEIHHSDERTGISDLDSAPNVPVGNNDKSEVRIKLKDKMETDFESMFKEEAKSNDSKSINSQNEPEPERIEKTEETNAQPQICQEATISEAVGETESLESMLAQCADPTHIVVQKNEQDTAVVEKMETDALESILGQTENIVETEATVASADIKTSEVNNDKIEVDLERILAQAQIGIERETPQISEPEHQPLQDNEIKLNEFAQQNEQKAEQLAETEIMETDCLESVQTENITTSEPIQQSESSKETESPQETEQLQESKQNVSMDTDSNNVEIQNNTIEEILADAEINIVQDSKLQESEQKEESVSCESELMLSEKEVETNTINRQEGAEIYTRAQSEQLQETEVVLTQKELDESIAEAQSEQKETKSLQEGEPLQDSESTEKELEMETTKAFETKPLPESELSEKELEMETTKELETQTLQESESLQESKSLQESELTEKELEMETIKVLESFKEK